MVFKVEDLDIYQMAEELADKVLPKKPNVYIRSIKNMRKKP